MKVTLTPLDTWFFRDSTPFDKGASPQAWVAGIFPPPPQTVAGALRAGLARSNGWKGDHTRWAPDIAKVLGDTTESMGQLKQTGPFLLENGVPLLPMPSHVLGAFDAKNNWKPLQLLRPGPPDVLCDLGDKVRLPTLRLSKTHGQTEPPTKLSPSPHHFLTRKGLEDVLRGELPKETEIRSAEQLWSQEPRVGIARKRDTRTVEDGALYSTRHVRLKASVALGVKMEGLPPHWKLPTGTLLPLGGESRLASCDEWKSDFFVPKPAESRPHRFFLLVLTPALLSAEEVRGQEGFKEFNDARIACACLEKPLRLGGWDSSRKMPLPLRSAVAPGSVLFLESRDGVNFNQGLIKIGRSTETGFGLCAVGTALKWEDKT